MWFTVPAKPSSAPLFFVTAAVFLAVHLGRRIGSFALITCGWGVGWTAFGVLAGWWPTSFLSVLRSAAEFPPLHENQTIGGAFKDVLRTPKVAWHDLSLLRPAAIVLVVVAASIAPLAFRRGQSSRALRLAPLGLCTLAAVGTAVPWPLLGEPNPPVRSTGRHDQRGGAAVRGRAPPPPRQLATDRPAATDDRGLHVAALCIASSSSSASGAP